MKTDQNPVSSEYNKSTMYKNIYLEEWLLLQAIGVLTFLARKKQKKYLPIFYLH